MGWRCHWGMGFSGKALGLKHGPFLTVVGMFSGSRFLFLFVHKRGLPKRVFLLPYQGVQTVKQLEHVQPKPGVG